MAMFGGMFSINGDGKISCMEKVMGCGWGNRRRGVGSEYFASRSHNAYPAGREVDDAVFDEIARSVNLIICGLDADDLRKMGQFERYEALVDAGLDPEDYDYLED